MRRWGFLGILGGAALFWGRTFMNSKFALLPLVIAVIGLGLWVPARAQQSQDRTSCYDEKNNAEQTIAGCTALIQSGREILAVEYYNRGIAWRHKGDNDQAIADYTEAIRLNPNYASAFKNRGRANFFIANYVAAASDLTRGVQEKPDDAHAVIWLYLARARSGSQNAAAELETNAAILKQSDWPYPVIELFLGRRAPETMQITSRALSVASNPDAPKKPSVPSNPDAPKTLSVPSNLEDRCEARFYVGEWYLLQGDRARAATALKAAADTCPKTFIEYTGAQAELKRLEQ